MTGTKTFESFYSFMCEYVIFLENMVEAETDRMYALSEWDLQKVEKSIAISQANAKKLENMELKRIRLQQEHGWGQKTFKEIIEIVPENEKNKLEEVFVRFEGAVNDIKFHNEKSMAVAKDNMMRMDPEFVLQAANTAANSTVAGTTNPYQNAKNISATGNQVLKTDI